MVVLMQETCQLLVFVVQNASSTFVLIVTFTFMRACIIALVVKASANLNPLILS